MTTRIPVSSLAVLVSIGFATLCQAQPPPPAPTDLDAVAVTTTQVDLSWTDLADGEQGYLVQRRQTDTDFASIGQTDPDAEAFEDMDVVANTAYWYQVGVIEASGRVRAWSNVADVVTTILPPAPPQDVLAVAVSPSQITLTWTDASTTEDGFLIQRDSGEGLQDLAAVGADIEEYADVGVLGGHQYDYRLCAQNSGGNSDWSDTDRVVAALPRTAMQIGMRRWYEGIETGDAFPAGLRPAKLLFDGAHIWVTNPYDTVVTKLRAADGKVEATITVGQAPTGIGFDGTKIWVGCTGQTLYVFDADYVAGDPMQTVWAGGNQPSSMVFDGQDMWVMNSDSQNVVEFNVEDLSINRIVPTDSYPSALTYDGTYVWVCRQAHDRVRQIVADGDNPDAWTDFDVGDYPWGIAFDGANIWVSNREDGTVTKLRAHDGFRIGDFPAGPDPWDVAFDGAHIWVVNHGWSQLTKLRAADGTSLAPIAAPMWSTGIAFDGANIWICDPDNDQVLKR